MSSVFKGIKKVFKKVVNVVKKIAPVVLAVAAIVYTGGAALGLSSFAGGWGAAAATVSQSLGASGVLGSALTGAITQAGYGALVGGAAAAATGGSVSRGLQRGAAAGAITGGVTGTVSGLRNANAAATAGQSSSQGVTIDGATGQPISGGAKTFPMPEAGAPGAPQAIDAAGEVVTQAPATSGGLLSKGGWLERNQTLAGNVIKGVGTGLLSGSAADSERDLIRERQKLISDNYAGADPGASYRTATPGNGQAPAQRFDRNYYGSWEYRYVPESGRIEKVPTEG